MSGRDVQLAEYFLLAGYIFFNTEPSLISTVVGSSVAVSLWDQKKKYGGMTHFLYPLSQTPEAGTAQYGNIAVRYLVKMLRDEGTKERDIKAQIFGGAKSSTLDGAKIARDNIRVARDILRKCKIEVISEDVGGNVGRKIVYNTLKNETIVYKVQALRSSDWYPYCYGEDRD